MKTKILLGCFGCLLLIAGALFLHTPDVSAKKSSPQKAAATSTGTRLKLLRRVNLEHFGGTLAAALGRFPAAGKAYDVTGITAKPRKGFSFWNAEGGILVMLAYDPEAGTPAPTEVVLPQVETIDPYISVVMSFCCCAAGGVGAEGGCKLEGKGGALGQCSGKECCGQSVALVHRMGEAKVHGASCFAAPAAR